MRLRFELWAAAVVSMSLAACDDSYDWCTEAQDERFVRATGQVSIRYEGDRVKPGTVEIEPYVGVGPSGAIRVQGCGKRDGDLWRWRGGFAVSPTATAVPISDADGGVQYEGDVRVCRDADCSNVDAILTVSDPMPGAWAASGTVSEYDPAGKLRASVGTQTAAGDHAQIEVDIQWEPAEASTSGE